MNFHHSFRTEAELTLNKKACKDHDFCHINIVYDETILLSNIFIVKHMRVPYIIYADTEKLQDTC